MKIKVWCCTHDLQSKEEEIIDLAKLGFTDSEIENIKAGNGNEQLNEVAKDFFYETKQPEWGFEIIDN